MKRNTSAITLIISCLALVISIFVINNKRVDRLEKQLQIEKAKTSFILSKIDNTTLPYDSTYAHDDTIQYYKNSSFVGKSVITIDQQSNTISQ